MVISPWKNMVKEHLQQIPVVVFGDQLVGKCWMKILDDPAPEMGKIEK